jgi:hypothetical protein
MNEIMQGLPFSEYRRRDGINASLLSDVRKSTLHARYNIDNARPGTDAMRLGTIAHAMLLEGGAPLIVAEYDRRTNAGKAAYADAQARAGSDGIICTPADHAAACAMREAVMRNPMARLIVEQTQHEVSIFWSGAYGHAKGRADMLSASKLADYKTTAQIEPGAFMRTAENLWYHGKMGWYAEGLKAITGDIPEAWIIAQEAAAPYDVAVYRMPAHVIEQGRKDAHELAMRWRVAVATGIYQGVAPDVLEYERPAWAAGGDDVEIPSGNE